MSDALLLAIDTSTTSGSVALCRGELLLAEILIDSPANHSDRLLLLIEQILSELRCDLSQIDAFAVVDGPGSFTGLRIGVTAAKGLAWACQRPLFGVSSLQVLASTLPYALLPVCTLLDARKNEVYAATFSTMNGSPVLLNEPRAVSPQRLLAEMDSPAIFVGSGALLYRELINNCFGSLTRFAPFNLHTPRASCAAQIAMKHLSSGKDGDPLRLLPRYIRPSDAEIAQQKA